MRKGFTIALIYAFLILPLNAKELVFKEAYTGFKNLPLVGIKTFDFDSDGQEDIIVSDSEGNLFLYNNVTSGADSPEFIEKKIAEIPVGSTFHISDLDLDGSFDVVVENREEGRFSRLQIDTENETFKSYLIYNSPLTTRESIVFDANNDGYDEIVFAEDQTGAYLLQNLKAGNFERIVLTNTGFYYSSIDTCDFNFDGLTDLVLSSKSSHSVELLINQGNFEFEHRVISNTMPSPGIATACDIDYDGDTDIFVANGDELIWMKNEGDEFSNTPVSQEDGNILNLIIEDIDNSDGYELLLSTETGSVALYTYSENEFQLNSKKISELKESLLIADINGSGLGDLISISEDSMSIKTYLEIANENITEKTAKTCHPSQNFTFLDNGTIMGGTPDKDEVYLFRDSVFVKAIDDVPGSGKMLLKDFDRDGKKDILSSSTKNNMLYILADDCNSNYTPHIINENIYKPSDYEIVDYDGYNKRDILVSSYGKGEVYLLRQSDDFSFESEEKIFNCNGVKEILAERFSGGKDLEIICAVPLYKKLSFYTRDDKGYTETVIDNSISSPACLEKVDIDNDNDTDFLCADVSSGSIYLYENEGGNFSKSVITKGVQSPSFIRIFDIDENEYDDILVAGNDDSEIRCILNHGHKLFHTLVIPTSFAGISCVQAGLDSENNPKIYYSSSRESQFGFAVNTSSGQIPAPTLKEPARNADSVILDLSYVWTGNYEPTNDFRILIAEDASFSKMILDSIILDSEVYNDNDTLLNYSSQYFWKVAQIGVSDTSAWSETRSFYTEDLGPVVLRYPENGEDKVARQPLLTWRKIDAVDTYTLILSKNPDLSEPELEINGIEDDFYQVYNVLNANTRYYWAIGCKNSKAAGFQSETFSFTTGETTGIDDSDEICFSIFPNPASSSITISGKNDVIKSIKIYSETGILVDNIEILLPENSVNVEIAKLPRGMYSCTIKTDSGSIKNIKFIKN
jgi:hypothetical protein